MHNTTASTDRRELQAALTVFIRLGTPIQEEKARRELASIGGKPAVTRTSRPWSNGLSR